MMTMTETCVLEIQNLILNEIQNSPKKTKKKVSFSKSLESIRCFRRADPVLKVKYPNAPLNEYGSISHSFISSHSLLGIKSCTTPPTSPTDFVSSSQYPSPSSYVLGTSPPTPSLLKSDNFAQLNHLQNTKTSNCTLSNNFVTPSSALSSYTSFYNSHNHNHNHNHTSTSSAPSTTTSSHPQQQTYLLSSSSLSKPFPSPVASPYSTPGQFSIRSQACSMAPLSDLIERTKRNGVSVDGLHLRGLRLEGHAAVHNISFEKKVTVRFTFDDWKTTEEVAGQYESSDPSGQVDRFSFCIPLEDCFLQYQQQQTQSQTQQQNQNQQQSVCMTMYLAIRYVTRGNVEYWDNNNGLNHRVDFISNYRIVEKKQPTLKTEERVSSLSLSLALEENKIQERSLMQQQQLLEQKKQQMKTEQYGGHHEPKTVAELFSIPIGPDTPPTQHLTPPPKYPSTPSSSPTSSSSDSRLKEKNASYGSSPISSTFIGSAHSYDPSTGLSVEPYYDPYDLDSPVF